MHRLPLPHHSLEILLNPGDDSIASIKVYFSAILPNIVLLGKKPPKGHEKIAGLDKESKQASKSEFWLPTASQSETLPNCPG